MATPAMPARRQPLAVEIEASPAYEFLMTLCVFSDCENHRTIYDAGSAWFDAIHAKASPDLLVAITQFSPHSHEIWEHLLSLAYECPIPRDVPTLIAHFAATEPLELRLHLLGYYLRTHRRATPSDIIFQAAKGDPDAQKQFLKTSFPDDADWQKTLRQILTLDPEETKTRLLNILQCWYNEIFRDQEPQVLSILARDVEAKRALKSTVSPERLIELLTGWEYVPEPAIRRVVLIPSFILRPWVAISEHNDVRIFCYPVADESITADSDAPPARLIRLSKALGDERRLRILKKLATGSYTLQEVADDFGVAKSTMHHHLAMLRAAGLVRIRMSDKRYTLRSEVIQDISELLNAYLKGASL